MQTKKENHANKYLKGMTLHMLLQIRWFLESGTTFCASIGFCPPYFLFFISTLLPHLFLENRKTMKK
jgi:hypothetical protein